MLKVIIASLKRSRWTDSLKGENIIGPMPSSRVSAISMNHSVQ